MKRDLIVFILITIAVFGGILGLVFLTGENPEFELPFLPNAGEDSEQKIVREPIAAGNFYPESETELRNQINQFLTNTQPPEAEGMISALILPHAGYEFSGQVAAYGFKKLIGEDIDTVIIIGNSHQQGFDGISVYPKGFFKTPLGEVKIDSDLAEKIMQSSERIFFQESSHQVEHSLEVEIPFLQLVLKNFKIAPILFGNSSSNDYEILARAIANNIRDENVLIVASSDLSHYPNYEDATRADSKTIEAILTGDVSVLEKTIQDLEKEKIPQAVTFACGIDAIKTIMLVSKELGAKHIKLLNHANSGDVSQDKSKVVGYAAVGFFGERRGHLLNKDEQEKLFAIARESVESYVKEGKMPSFKVDSPFLNEYLGAFVTLKKHGQLRGCIGRFSPTDIPLYQVVSQMAIASATQDMRFSPVTSDELQEIEYEISVLSALQKIDNWQEVEVGKHGVQIRKGLKSGVFLPQVATENNWNLERFLAELCSQKAGLSADCFKQQDAELYTFTAQVF